MVAYMIVDDSFFLDLGGFYTRVKTRIKSHESKRKRKLSETKDTVTQVRKYSNRVILGIGDTQNKILTHKKLQNKEYNKMRNMAYNKIAPESTF